MFIPTLKIRSLSSNDKWRWEGSYISFQNPEHFLLGLPMLKFDIEIRKILSHGSTFFDWWNKISKYFDSLAIQSMSNRSFKKMKFFMSTEKIYNITEFDFRSKTITDSGSNNSNGNIHHVIIKVIWTCANVLICDQN